MPNRLLLAGLKVIFRSAVFFDRPAPRWDPGSVRSILLVNTTAMGDTLLSTPAIRAIRAAFPKANLVSLASRAAKEVLLHNPHLDRIIDHPGRVNLSFFFQLPKLLKTIRAEKCDLAVILDGNDPEAAPLSYLSGARYRIGWSASRLAFLLTRPVDFNRPDRHHIEVWQDHLSALGIAPQGTEMELTLSTAEKEEAERYLTARKLSDRPIVGLHPFARKLAGKEWPFERVVALSALLADQGYRPVLFGGAKEKKDADEMVMKSDGRLTSFAGELSLRQTMALIARCELLIGLDSGPMHISQALGVPTLALFGPSDPRASGPLKTSSSAVLKKDFACSPCGWAPCPHQLACMRAIEVEEVAGAAGSLLRDR
jgi:lipopolysaccharide heptosyltransferase II